jgi:hypothetical protein
MVVFAAAVTLLMTCGLISGAIAQPFLPGDLCRDLLTLHACSVSVLVNLTSSQQQVVLGSIMQLDARQACTSRITDRDCCRFTP